MPIPVDQSEGRRIRWDNHLSTAMTFESSVPSSFPSTTPNATTASKLSASCNALRTNARQPSPLTLKSGSQSRKKSDSTTFASRRIFDNFVPDGTTITSSPSDECTGDSHSKTIRRVANASIAAATSRTVSCGIDEVVQQATHKVARDSSKGVVATNEVFLLTGSVFCTSYALSPGGISAVLADESFADHRMNVYSLDASKMTGNFRSRVFHC